MASTEASVKFKLESKEFNSAIKEASAQVREMQSALKTNEAQMKTMGTSADALTQREKLLAQEAQALADKKEALAGKLEVAERCFGENSTQASSLRTQLNNLETQSVKVEAEMADVANQLKEQADAAEKSETATERLTNTIDSQQSELDELKQEYVEAVLQYGKNSDEAKELAGQIDSLSGELKENKDAMSDAEAAADELDQTVGDAGDAAKDAGKDAEESSGGWTTLEGVVADLTASAIKQAISSLGDLSSAALDAAKELDEGYDTIITKTGATGEALEGLTDVADNVFTSLPVEMADVGTAVGEVNTRFQSTDEELENLTAQFLEFAEINGVDVNNSIDTVDKIMTQWGIDTKDTASVLGLLTKEGQDTGISLDSLMQSASDNSSTFKQLGFSFEESIALMAQMEANGVDSSTALSGLKKAVTNLTDAGMSEEEALQSVIGSIKNASTETEALSIAQETFGTKGAAEMATAIREGRLDIDDLSISMEDYATTVEDTYNATLSPWDELTVATNNLKTAGSELATDTLTSLMPAIEKAVGRVEDLSDTVGNAKEYFDDWASSTDFTPITNAFSNLQEKAEPLIDTISDGLSWGYENVLKPLGTWTLNSGLPAVLEAVGSAFGLTNDVLTALRGPAEWIWNNLLEPLASWTGRQFVSNMESVSDVLSTVGGVIGGIPSTVSGAWNAVTSATSTAWNAVTGAIVTSTETSSASVENEWNAATKATSTAWDDITSATSTAWDTTEGAISTSAANAEESAANEWDSLKSATSSAWNNVSSATSSAWNDAKTAVSTAASSAATAAGDKWNSIKSTTSNAWTNVKSLTSSAWTIIKTTISTGAGAALTTVTSKFNAIKSKISSVMDSAKSAVSNAIKAIKDKFNFTWSLPKLKLPHVSITGSFSLSPPSVPKFSVSWYKEGAILEAATIFGAAGGNLLGGGEAGPEAVAPIDVLQDYVAAAVDSTMSASMAQLTAAIEAMANRPIVFNVNGRTMATATSGDYDAALGTRQTLTARGLAL